MCLQNEVVLASQPWFQQGEASQHLPVQSEQ